MISMRDNQPYTLKWMLISLIFLFSCLISTPVTAAGDEVSTASIELEPLLYTMVRNSRPKAQVIIRVGIQLIEGADFESVNNRVPQLRSDFLSIIATVSSQRFRIGRAIDPAFLREYFQMAADRRLGKNQVTAYVLEAGITPL